LSVYFSVSTKVGIHIDKTAIRFTITTYYYLHINMTQFKLAITCEFPISLFAIWDKKYKVPFAMSESTLYQLHMYLMKTRIFNQVFAGQIFNEKVRIILACSYSANSVNITDHRRINIQLK